MPRLHTIIVANTSNLYNKNITQRCIDTLWEFGEACINEVVVVEAQPSDSIGVKYKGAISVHPNEPFSTNRFRNIGYEYLRNKVGNRPDYVMFAGSELSFERHWFNPLITILNRGYDSVSPFCTRNDAHRNLYGCVKDGWGNGVEFTEWCVLFKSDSLEKLMPISESNVNLDCLIKNMQDLNMKHAFVGTSFVTRNVLFSF